MTGQVQFDSHVLRLLETTVQLVNALTDGVDGARPFSAPTGEERRVVVAAVLQVASREDVKESDAERLTELAHRAREVVEAVAREDQDTAAAIVNSLLVETRARPRLDPAAAGGWALHFHGPDDTLARGWAAGVAAGLAVAIGSGLGGRLGVCDASGCDRVYLDSSRNSGRRFCGTRCQNRMKAAAHRNRRTPTP